MAEFQYKLPGVRFPSNPVDDWSFKTWGSRFSPNLIDQVKRPRSLWYPPNPFEQLEMPWESSTQQPPQRITPSSPQPRFKPPMVEPTPNAPISPPKTPSMLGRVKSGGLRALGTAGKGLGVLGAGATGAELLEGLFPSTEYNSPADIGAKAYDYISNIDLPNPMDIPGRAIDWMEELAHPEGHPHTRNEIRPFLEREPSAQQVTRSGKDVELVDLPDLPSSPDIYGRPAPDRLNPFTLPRPEEGGGQGGGTVKRATIRPKKRGSPLAGFSMGKQESLDSLPGDRLPIMDDLEPIPASTRIAGQLQSGDLPDMISLGDKTENTAIENKGAKNPDFQQSSAMAKYMRLIESMPDEDNYSPSIWRRFLGAAAGLSEGWQGGAGRGLATSTGFTRQPYFEALNQWKGQLDELEPLMEAESREVMNRERIQEQARKTDLINQTKTVENEIKRLAAEGKIKNDSERNSITRRLAEIRQDIANGQMEIATAKLEEMRTYHKGLLGLGAARVSNQTRDVNSKIADREFDNKNPKNTGGKNKLLTIQRARRLAAQDMDTLFPGYGNITPNRADWEAILDGAEHDTYKREDILKKMQELENKYVESEGR